MMKRKKESMKERWKSKKKNSKKKDEKKKNDKERWIWKHLRKGAGKFDKGRE